MKEKKPEAVPVGAAFEVMNSLPRARARALVDRRDIYDIPCSQTARPRVRTRVKDPAAYFRAWRIARWSTFSDRLKKVEKLLARP